jgi:hypothetical protein
VDDDIESHELPEGLVVETEHLSEVGTVVESGVGLRHVVDILVAVVEDDGSDSGDAGAHIEGIFKSGVPILALVNAVAVGLGELAEGLASEDTHGELSHGVHVLGEALDEVLDVLGDLASVEELSLEFLKLGVAWELSCEEEPEGSFGEGLRAAWGLVALFSDLVEIFTAVGDTIEVVKLGSLIEETRHASHTTDNLADSNIAELGVTVLLLEVVKNLLFLVDGVLNLLLEGS